MKYALKVVTKSKLAAIYAMYCAEGKAGEILIKAGCNTDAFAQFAASVAHKSVDNGEPIETTAERFKQLCIGNASQVRQAIQEIEINVDDAQKKDDSGPLFIPVSVYWQRNGLVEQPIVSRLGAL